MYVYGYPCVKGRIIYLAACFVPNNILLPDIACLMILVHIMCKLQEISETCSLLSCSVTKAALFSLVVKSNIPSDSISSALQVLILYPACVHAFPCHPLLFSHLSLCLSVRDQGVMKSLCPRGNRRHVD